MLRYLLLFMVIVCATGVVIAKKESAPAKGKQEQPLPKYTGPKKRLAVMDFDVKVNVMGTVGNPGDDIPPPTDFGTGLTEMLTTALVGTERFIMLERKALNDIMAEQALGASGAVDQSSAPPQGKLLGAQALVRGAVTEYSFRRSSKGGEGALIPGIGISMKNAEASVALDVRLYNAMTGQILDSVKAEGRAKGSGFSLKLTGKAEEKDWAVSSSAFQQSPLGQATRQALEKAVALIVQRMDALPWECTIAELDAGEDGVATTIYLNEGSAAGVKVGDCLDIFRPGRSITDPKTKVVIGRTKDTRVGRCRIESVTEILAVAVPIEGSTFSKDDVARFVAPIIPAPAPVTSPAETTTK